MSPRAPSITLTFDLNELREIESGLAGVIGGYDEAIELHHRNRDEAGASRLHKASQHARRAFKRVAAAAKGAQGLSSGRQSGREMRELDVTKARAAMTAAAAELTARDRLQRDQTRNVRIAVAALNIRSQGLRPATMGEIDVYEALARHGLAEAPARGNVFRPGHLSVAASTLLTVQDHMDARDMLEDAPGH